jgi:hypothetical protein
MPTYSPLTITENTTRVPLWILAHNCRLAGDTYQRHIDDLLKAGYEYFDQLVLQFAKQRDDALTLARFLENHDDAQVVDNDCLLELEVTLEPYRGV